MKKCTLNIALFAKLCKMSTNVHYIPILQTCCSSNILHSYLNGNYYKLNIVPQATLGSDLNYKMNAYICHYNIKVVTSPTTVIW